jgi:hypothetical protein
MRLLTLTTISFALAASAGPGAAQEYSLAAPARVHSAGTAAALAPPSSAGALDVVRGFLRERGVSPLTLDSLRRAREHHVARTGMTHLWLEQEVAGRTVHDAYAKAAFNDRGELVHLIEGLVPVPTADVRPARIGPDAALGAALRRLYPGLAPPPEVGRRGAVVLFDPGRVFYRAPRVTPVAVPAGHAFLSAGFLVETWSRAGNQLHETLVGGDGRVLSVVSRTNEDEYAVFPEHPDKTEQQMLAGPGSGNEQSPIGWLFPEVQTSVDIAGNNVHAYLDTDADDAADGGGDPVPDGRFVTPADLTVSPSTDANRAVAVQNLFYLNNAIHDELYRHGFTETAGNFQQDNFGSAGLDGDPVNAEAQDGSGTDNANFATPPDGHSPRMQMFLWTGKGDHQVVVHPPAAEDVTYPAQGAEFGPPLDASGLTGPVSRAEDGVGVTSDACEELENDLTGKIALVDRGSCTFVLKVSHAQAVGAIAVIVANNLGDSILTMGGEDATIAIPSVFVGQGDGLAIASGIPAITATVRRTDPPPLQRDGDLDSDIVWHEYGHGLTWRMIGSMSGPLAGAVGEGVSDWLSILVNEDDVVGEYSYDDPGGIRRFPYTDYPLTYGDVTGAEVHDDGEVYAAIGWRLWEIFQREGLGRDLLLDYAVDGMNYTPRRPAFEDMRHGILESVLRSGTGHECLVWEAFAAFGVGTGARGRVRGQTAAVVTESFRLPPRCARP